MSKTQSILRHSSAPTENPPFFPSPQWLSESPARPPTSSSRGTPATPFVDHNLGQGTPRVQALSTPVPQQLRDPGYLRSPVPPPPANLYKGGATALNVDPGVPFLATAGSHPTDAGSDNDSVHDEPRPNKLTGSIMSGLKRAVGSLKKGTLSTKSQGTGMVNTYAPPPPQAPDSGYGDSTPQLVGPSTFPGPGTDQRNYAQTENIPQPQPTNAHVQPYSPSSSSRSSVSQHAPTPAHIMSPRNLFSPVSATPEFGPDYAQMNPPTPPPSDVSFNTYLTRAERIVAKIAALPWIAPERPTVDYYPERSRRRDEPKHAPQIAWHAADYARPSFKVATGAGMADDASDADTWASWEEFQREGDEGKMPILAITPHKGSQVDLGEEFEEAPPLPANPPGFTPRYKTQSIYGNTPAGSAVSMGLPRSRLATPEQYRPPLPQEPPIFSPLPQDPPDHASNPIVHPQPRHSPNGVFRPPTVLDDRASGMRTPRVVSRASSRGYALYDPPVPGRGGSPTSARSGQRISEHRASSGRAPSLRAVEDPPGLSMSSRGSAQGYTQSSASLTVPSRSSRGSTRLAAGNADWEKLPPGQPLPRKSDHGYARSSASSRPARQSSHGSAGPPGDVEWEQYPAGRTGYIPYDEARAQGYYVHRARSGSESPLTPAPRRDSGENSPRSFPFQ